MANFTPSASWTWLTSQQQLALRYGVVSTEQQLTPVLSTEFAAEAGSAFAFTLAHAELFWTFWHALEPLQFSEPGRFAAAVDATACACFLPQQGQKSWHFQTLSTNYVPAIGDLVLLAGAGTAARALVVDVNGQSSLVLLLEDLVSLSGKPLAGGKPMMVLHNRLQVWQVPANHSTALPKSA